MNLPIGLTISGRQKAFGLGRNANPILNGPRCGNLLLHSCATAPRPSRRGSKCNLVITALHYVVEDIISRLSTLRCRLQPPAKSRHWWTYSLIVERTPMSDLPQLCQVTCSKHHLS